MSPRYALEDMLAVNTAIAALRLKRHHLSSSPDGVVIEQPGKPDLLLTFESAKRFSAQIDEATA